MSGSGYHGFPQSRFDTQVPERESKLLDDQAVGWAREIDKLECVCHLSPQKSDVRP